MNDAVFGPSQGRLDHAIRNHRRTLIALVLAMAFAAGAYLRLHNIGKFGFWTDEYFHVFGAQSLLRDGSLTVPLHGQYERAKLITYMTAGSFKLFGVSESSARAPFAVVNLLFLGAAFLFIRRLYGWLPAIATFCALSLSPFMIEMSRECRMYPVFQLAYFSMAAMFLLGFEPFRQRPGWEGRIGIDVRWLIGSAAIFPLALHVHDLTLNFGIVVIAYCAGVFLWECASRGVRSAALSKYGLLLGVVLVGGVAGLAIAGDEIVKLARSSREVPDWATAGLSAVNFYRYMLSDGYPLFFFAYPLAAFVFMKDHGRRGFFAVVSFTVLFILHSYVFGRKGDRYIFYIFPYFILVSSSLAASAAATLADRFRAALSETSRWIRLAGWIAVLPALYVAAYPWLSNAARVPQRWHEIDWKANIAEVQAEEKDAEIIHTSPMPYVYYFGQVPDFYMLGEIWKGYDHEGRLVRNAADLQAVLARPGIQVIVTDQGRIGNNAFITPDMEEVINAKTRVERSSVDRRIRYYREITPSDPRRNDGAFSAPKKSRP